MSTRSLLGRSRSIAGRRGPRPLPPDVPDVEDDPAELERLRPLPALGATMRLAANDLYYNSWRLAPANLVWGAVAILALLAGPMTIVGLGLLVLLAVPTAGLHRMGALIARGEPAGFSDFLDGMRRFAAPAMLACAGAIAAALVLTTNVVVGLQAGNPVGWFISALALWGSVALAMALVAFWPVLADPHRDGQGLLPRLKLAGLAVLGRPRRMFALSVAVTLILIASTVLFAALVVVSVAYVSVLSCRYVLPTIDELESRLIV